MASKKAARKSYHEHSNEIRIIISITINYLTEQLSRDAWPRRGDSKTPAPQTMGCWHQRFDAKA